MRLINLSVWKMDSLITGNHCFQIQEFIIEMIKQGFIKPAGRLPSQRDFAKLNNVNVNAVKKAYLSLAASGVIKTKEGSGSYLSKDITAQDLPIQASEFDGKLPVPIQLKRNRVSKKILNQNFITVGMETLNPWHYPERAMFKYQRLHRKRYAHITQMEQVNDLHGQVFQESIRNYFNISRDFNISNRCMKVIMGRTESLNGVFGLLLKPGEAMVNTAAQDLLLNDCLNQAQAKQYALSTLNPDFMERLTDLLKTAKIKVLYLRPQCGYPECNHLSVDTCLAVIELAKKHKFYILEEDEYHEFWYQKEPYLPLASYPHQGHVIYLSVLSQLSVYMLNTRILVANQKIVSLLNEKPVSMCPFRCVIEENAIVDLLNSGEQWHAVKQARLFAMKSRDILFWSLDNYLGDYIKLIKPDSGLCYWLEFPKILDLKAAMGFLEGEEIDVPFKPGIMTQLIKIYNMRLGFGTFKPEEAEMAAKLLRKKFDEIRS